MSTEVIALSDALDLIMQSKTDIKSSVQNKGSEIGDDLTQYAQSIDNIQFRSLQFKNNDTGDMQTSFDVSRYNDTANVSVQQYINGETSYPVNTSYTVSGTSISVTKNTPGTNKQVYRCVPTDYGTTILTIEDTVGNVEYPITLYVPTFTIHGDYDNTMSGFDSFQWDENIPGEGADTLTGWNAAWDTSVQQNPNFTATFSFNDGNGHNVDTANLSFDITGDVIDAGFVTVTYVLAATSVTFTFTPYYNNDDSQYEYYNGVINIAISDGTSTGDIAPIYLTGGSDIPAETYYIYAGNITHATVTFDEGVGITEGTTETITVTPDSGYVLNTLVVEGDTTGDTISTTDLGNGEYSFVMPAENVNIHVNCRQAGPQSISEVKQLNDDTSFTFDGTVTVINKSSNNRELYVQDANGNAGIQLLQDNIGSSFATGDVIYSGWSGTKYTTSHSSSIKNITNLNYSSDTTTLIATERTIRELAESDVYNYLVIRNILFENNIITQSGDSLSINNKFNISLPTDTTQHYDVYGVLKLGAQNYLFYPMSFETPAPAEYSIRDGNISMCTVSYNPNPAAEGDTVTITVTPNPGEEINNIWVKGFNSGNTIQHTSIGNNQYTFVMPAENVEVDAN